ncbi:MAG: hypothetical protein KatS3mg108_0555 [Isosphaeraceae bacterium]|jgi:enoyl-CoA hydratase/carnithine racemase|nr:MAG: hypothetical protein KatS3mg108_0555 [Isosphaeraceae bacterium]
MSAEIGLEYRNGIARVVIDRPGQKVNALSRAVLRELDAVIEELMGRVGELVGVVVASGKAGQFVAGADLKEILVLIEQEPGEVAELVALGHRVYGRLARLPVPTVAEIDGPCLGGGLELALACDGRVASERDGTRLGLPEVGIGLMPSWGGTQRLPRLIATDEAARMILGGQPVAAGTAESLGLVDALSGSEALEQRAEEWLERERKEGCWTERRRKRSGSFGGLPAEPPEPKPEAEESARAYEAAWSALVQGAGLELGAALEVEQGLAVPLFLADGIAERIRATLSRRGQG